jgi:photosystem II stability/assembly factor-like uncharacterized protein
VHFIDAAAGWGIESTGHVVRTTDGGYTWWEATPPRGYYGHGKFYVLGGQTAWAVDSAGRLVRTLDGGASWQDIIPSQEGYGQGAIFRLDAQNAWAAPFPESCPYWGHCPESLPGYVWRTTDGGSSWQTSQAIVLPFSVTFSPLQIQFVDPLKGWLLIASSESPGAGTEWTSLALFKTEDGGEHWSLLPQPNFASGYGPNGSCTSSILFTGEQTGWENFDCFLKTTTDGGLTWSDPPVQPQWDPEQDRPSCPSVKTGGMLEGPEFVTLIQPLARFSPQTLSFSGKCIPYRHNAPPPRSPFYENDYVSMDQGRTWQVWLHVNSVSFVNEKLGLRLSSTDPDRPNQLQQTVDGGMTWTTLKDVTWQSAQFSFTSRQTGWAIVGDGANTALVRTVDEGRTWALIEPVIVRR